MSGLYESTQRYMREHRMMPEGGWIVAAVSGGADSMCLLHLLRRLEVSLGIETRCVHVHHGLRGPEADRDADFVARICAGWGVPCRVVRRDVRGYARERGLSLEEAGRILRYEALEEEADAWGARGIATAHHAEDQAETVLHHLIRGSGLRGLSGIQPVRGRVLRPILFARKEQILQYLEGQGVPHCEDSTNRDDAFTRNRIRSHVLPLLEQMNPRAVENILQASGRIAEADACLEREAGRLLEEWGCRAAWREAKAFMPAAKRADPAVGTAVWPASCGGAPLASFPAAAFLAQDAAVRGYVVKELLRDLAGSSRDITSRHVEAVAELARKGTGKELDLPYGLTARMEYGVIRIERREGTGGKARPGVVKEPAAHPSDGVKGPAAHPLDGVKEPAALLPDGELRVFPYEKGMEFPKNEYTKWFDYDKINDTPVWRFRRTGDYITLKGGGRKSVKHYMIDEKISKEVRDRIPLLADGSHILWIAGRRISESYKVTGQTRRVLEAVLGNGGGNGR